MHVCRCISECICVCVCVCVWKGGRQTKRKNPEEREGVKEIIIRKSWAICIRKQALPCQWDWHQLHLHVYDWFTCHGIYKDEFSVKLEKVFPPCVLHILHLKKFIGHTTHKIVPQPGLEPMPLALEAWSVSQWTPEKSLHYIMINIIA